jgi:hypothetical protein
MAEREDPSEPLPPALAAKLGRVGEGLRRAYDDAATEPLPDAFEDLLQQLR